MKQTIVSGSSAHTTVSIAIVSLLSVEGSFHILAWMPNATRLMAFAIKNDKIHSITRAT